MATSRYDFMKAGNSQDSKTGAYYPDPLTLNYNNFSMSSIPYQDVMTDEKIRFFWKEAYEVYGASVLDDVVLTLNGVPHKNLLNPGDKILFPSAQDIASSYSKEV